MRELKSHLHFHGQEYVKRKVKTEANYCRLRQVRFYFPCCCFVVDEENVYSERNYLSMLRACAGNQIREIKRKNVPPKYLTLILLS